MLWWVAEMVDVTDNLGGSNNLPNDRETGLPPTAKIGNMQFGRDIQIEIKNYTTRQSTIIPNDFEIEFSLFKTLDHVKEDDMGTVKVYGLTKERIKSFQEEGGEIIIHAGYNYGNQEIPVVFWGYITRLWGTIENNTTVLNIECSANMIDHTFSGTGFSAEGKNGYPFGIFLERVGLDYGYPNVYFDFRSVPKDDLNVVQDFITGFPFSPPVIGTSQVMFEAINTMFGITITKKTEESGIRGIDVVFTPKSVEIIKDINKKGYRRVDSAVSRNISSFKTLYEADTTSNNAVILDRYKGLISSSIEYKVVDARADLELGEHESETLESQGKRANTLAEWVEKEEEARKKAQAKGKEYKPKDPPKSLSKKKVNRRYNKVLALFNPEVLPQSLVVVYDSFEEHYSVFRVRSMQISCNNKSGNWTMDLNCEDSRNIALTPEQEEALIKIEQEQEAMQAPIQATEQVPLTGSSRRDTVMRFFMSKGWTKNQAAGITANLQIESTSAFDHTIYGDSGKAYGLAQWHADRQRDFANAFGRSIKGSSFQQQLEFVHFEMTQGKEQDAGRRLKSSTSAYQAGAVVSQFYERPQATEKEKRVRGNLAEAIAKAY